MYLQSISTLETKNMYPYSIHSQNYSLLINSQLNLGILLKNDINQHLHLQFDKTFNNAYFYNHYYQSNLGYLSLHSLFNNKLHTYFLLQRKPGILFALDKDMIDRHFIGNNDQYQELLNYLNILQIFYHPMNYISILLEVACLNLLNLVLVMIYLYH